MVIDPNLVKILACPDCKGDVEYSIYTFKSGKEKEKLICKKCKRNFEIKDGVPIMLPKNQI